MPRGSAAAFWLAQLTQVQMETVIADVAKQGAKDYRAKREALRPALHMRTKGKADRLEHYQQRPDRSWALMRQIFPEIYKQQSDDWHELEQEVRAGQLQPNAPPAPPPLPPEALPNIVTPGNPPGNDALRAAEAKNAIGVALHEYPRMKAA